MSFVKGPQLPDSFVPKIARAIGVLTSNNRGPLVASLAEGVVHGGVPLPGVLPCGVPL